MRVHAWAALAILILAAVAAATPLQTLRLDAIRNIASAADAAALKASLTAALQQLEQPLKEYETLPDGTISAVEPSPVAVIGGGLSGLTAALHLLEKLPPAVPVVVIDKQSFFGGNSAKASSGINGCPTGLQADHKIQDSADDFYRDTIQGAKREGNEYTEALVRKMVDDSATAVEWLAASSKVELPDVGMLGGHSAARTHRPRGKLSGAAFIAGLDRALSKHPAKKSGRLRLLKNTRLTGLTRASSDGGSGTPDWVLKLAPSTPGRGATNTTLQAQAVILATGGYSADKTKGGLLHSVAPELLTIGTTNGAFATGDGIKIARDDAGADLVDMDQVQVHPTGFSDVPSGFKQTGKHRALILCAEITRGVGGILLDWNGRRFVDELGTRKYVTETMRRHAAEDSSSSSSNNNNNASRAAQYVIALSPDAQAAVETHINIYSHKGLLHPVKAAAGVSAFVKKRLGGGCTADDVAATFKGVEKGNVDDDAPARGSSGRGGGKTGGVAQRMPSEESSTWYVGVVQPVVHYTMGGLAVDKDGAVLDEDELEIPGLYAAGEIMGGVHGENRLGGSSLLDCVVFGLASAKAVAARVAKTMATMPVSVAVPAASLEPEAKATSAPAPASAPVSSEPRLTGIPASERVNVKLNGQWYDISQFIPLHPGGHIAVKNFADLTKRFTGAHGKDWELLDREEVVPVTEDGTEILHGFMRKGKAKEHRLATYGGQGGSWREILGRHSWFLLHSLAAKYPKHPTEADKTAMRNVIAAFGQLYPCKLCRTHLQSQLRDAEMGPVALDTRVDLVQWVCRMHNIVNRDIGKPQYDCSILNLDLMYLKDCGECKPASETGANPKTLSGYHPYNGPWDADLYLSDLELLQDAKDKTQLLGARRHAKWLDTLKALDLDPDVVASVRGQLTAKGPGADRKRKAVAKAVKRAIADAVAAATAALDTSAPSGGARASK